MKKSVAIKRTLICHGDVLKNKDIFAKIKYNI